GDGPHRAASRADGGHADEQDCGAGEDDPDAQDVSAAGWGAEEASAGDGTGVVRRLVSTWLDLSRGARAPRRNRTTRNGCRFVLEHGVLRTSGTDCAKPQSVARRGARGWHGGGTAGARPGGTM